ncbi:sigma factor-like helix-turn-helix DNA-binding protein [Acetobacter sp.]|uniref:sigma factor-like helix-turn-helix DNA-binding protein n=1 Tax=Acetobacter sp. TaxID=440 RepID=UPI0039E7E129
MTDNIPMITTPETVVASPYRNVKIAEKRRKGATYKQLADEFSISKERVRQIIARQERIRKQFLERINAPLRHVT